MIPQNIVEQIKESAIIEDVVGEYVTLVKKGVNLTGLCPFHDEKTPSFSVSPAKNIYKCFGCGEAGDSVSFLMKHLNHSYPEALKALAKKYSITIEETEPDPEAEKKQSQKESLLNFNRFALDFYLSKLYSENSALGLEYIRSRYNDDIIGLFDIGFAPNSSNALTSAAKLAGYKEEFLLSTGLVRQNESTHKLYDFFRNRVMFPIIDRTGNVISFSGRVLPGADKKYGKYINGPQSFVFDKSKTLYGLNFALKHIIKESTTYLVEGNPDVMAMHSIGILNTIAPLGTALTIGQIKMIKRYAEKSILLYDGDPAGQKALIKNGKLLVEYGLIPYAAVLPKDEDPDSFFKNKKHFDNWIGKNKSDFINWYSTYLLSKAGIDPSLKNDAIQELAKMIFNLPKTKRDLYTDLISVSSKIKAKLFTDQFKELEAFNSKDDIEKYALPSDVDATDYELWGFYEHKNKYYFRTKAAKPEKLSNFVMKPVFHIDSIIDSKRIYEIINEHGYRVVVNLDMNEMTSLQGFQRNVESKGNFMFWGQMAQFQKLKLKLYEETRTCVEVKNLGWQREGYFAWANGMIDDQGNFVEIDEYGVINHNGNDYFIPAFSKIYLKDKSIFLDERKFQYKPSNITLKYWMELYLKVHGDNAMIAFAWYIAALFRDHILYLNDNFPLLNLFGQKGSGKNTLAYSLLSLFGKKQTEFNIHNGTKPGLAKHLEMFRNAIAFVDEYKNSLDFDKIETLKSIYNSIGRSRLNMDKGGKKEITEVNQAVIVAGQEMPTIDIALSTRMIFLQFLTKEGLSKEQKDDFEKLQALERDGLPHITAAFLVHRKYFIEHFKVNYDSVMRDILNKTSNGDINDRLLRNMCTVVASFKTLESKFDFSFNYEQLLSHGVFVTKQHNNQIKQSDEIGVFWSLLEALFDDNILIDKWHFKVSIDLSLNTTQGIKNFPMPGIKILKFKFNAVASLYATHLRRRGDKPLPLDSLKHYLLTHKYFIGIEKAHKFVRKDYLPGESKIVEQKQTTTAFCFAYDQLGVNLIRDMETDSDSNSTIQAPKDKLPF